MNSPYDALMLIGVVLGLVLGSAAVGTRAYLPAFVFYALSMVILKQWVTKGRAL